MMGTPEGVGRRRAVCLPAALLGAGVVVSFGQGAAADPCVDPGPVSVVVAAVESRGELRLGDGRLVRLVGFDPAQTTPDRPDFGDIVRADLADKLVGKAVRLRLLAPKPDRWGRLAAFVSIDDRGQGTGGQATGGAMDGGVAAAALAAGLGRYLAEPLAHACRAAFIRAETTARLAKLGLWADPYYAVLAVDDHIGFAERTGTVVLSEGTVTTVEPGPFRTVVRFVSPGQTMRGGHMLVATILPRVMKTFQAQQMDVSRLIGRRLRVRGLLDMRFGPRIELSGPDAVEIVEPSGTPAAAD